MNKINKNLRQIFPDIDPNKLDPNILKNIRNISNNLVSLDRICGDCFLVSEKEVSKFTKSLYSSLNQLKVSGYKDFDIVKSEVNQVRAQCSSYEDVFNKIASKYLF